MLRDLGFIFLFFIFLILWLVLWLAVHITVGFVHILIALAIIIRYRALCFKRQSISLTTMMAERARDSETYGTNGCRKL